MDLKGTPDNVREAAQLLISYTIAGKGSVWSLAGDRWKEQRREIMSLLVGKRVPLAAASCTKLESKFCELSGIGGDCQVARERNLEQWIQDLINEQRRKP